MAASWTLMVYMAGFNNLSNAATEDLEEMRSVGSSDDVKVAVFVKRLDRASAEYLIVGKGDEDEARKEIGNVDSGNPQTVLDFVRWAAGEAPAERYGLVVWNHGSGWQVDDLEQMYSEVRGGGQDGVSPRELGVRSTQQIGRALFSSSVAQVLSLETAGDRAIASDDGTGHSIDTIELGRVLQRAREHLGRPLELLGMDACLMSTLEVAYETQEDARVVVGSEELEPGDGWPYELIVADLVARPQMDGAALGKTIVDRYIESYRSRQQQWPVTQCAVAGARIGSFADTLDGLATALSELVADEVGLARMLRAHKASPRFTGELVDLKALCQNLGSRAQNGSLGEAATAVVDALRPGDYVLAEGHLGPKVKDVGGVTAYLPPPMVSLSRFYDDLSFAKQHGWDDFLRRYQSA